jgi:hypothetical protein
MECNICVGCGKCRDNTRIGQQRFNRVVSSIRAERAFLMARSALAKWPALLFSERTVVSQTGTAGWHCWLASLIPLVTLGFFAVYTAPGLLSDPSCPKIIPSVCWQKTRPASFGHSLIRSEKRQGKVCI